MTMVRRRLAILALSLAAAGPARADLLSPGELAKGHASLEGMANCTKCHEAGKRLSPTLCLECHNGLANFGRRADGPMNPSASHNLADPRYQNCTTCHVRIHGSNSSQVFFR